jgi:hypothetical protein
MAMRKVKIILGVAILVVAVVATWQLVGAYYGNAALKQDLQDIAADMATRIGLSQPPTEEDLRRFVIQKAASHDIELEPSQVTVNVSGEGKFAVISLAVDYHTKINLLVYSFDLHFQPSAHGEPPRPGTGP